MLPRQTRNFRPLTAPPASPGSRLRVLVVDDSVVMRRLVTKALEGIAEMEIVGTAANGRIALDRIPQVNPDVLTLDIEMPEMDGLETARRVRSAHPQIRIVMCSTLTQRGAAVTLEALSSGADDYVTKPSSEDSAGQSLEALKQQLVPKLQQFLRRPPSTPLAFRPPAKTSASQVLTQPSARTAVRTKRREIVAIGCSTGGPVALSSLISALPRGFRAPVLIVQHMPPMFTRLLAERLDTQTTLHVEEAKEGSVVEAGKVLVAPGDFHMTVRRMHDKVVTALNRGTPENSCRPAADVLFRSVAETYGASAVGVILTGMGHDGLRGLEQMRAGGAWVIAQDEASSVVWGMPGAVVGAGLADKVVPLRDVAAEIARQFEGV
ncbi:MAG: chemotaxis response regulator protein-glutamate methylesterase [Bryobacteraceae bacterium]